VALRLKAGKPAGDDSASVVMGARPQYAFSPPSSANGVLNRM
jgi:hypothetical protein